MTPSNMQKPKILITMGDVAGVGPEIIVKAWGEILTFCEPVVVGDPTWLEKAIHLLNKNTKVQVINEPEQAMPQPNLISCTRIKTADLSTVKLCNINASAGQAAHDYLIQSIDWALENRASAIVTAPLHKEGLHLAGLDYPGHTEILASRTKVPEHVMILALPELAVAHVTLHLALKNIFNELSVERIVARAQLLENLLTKVLGRAPRIAIAALNPHGSDGGLFGNEEQTIIQPATDLCKRQGMTVSGPIPADTLFLRASQGEFDGVVAMYHDQGHIALKLLGQRRAVNITAGLPIIRTSVAHGTAYDIAWKGIADESSLVSAAKWAVKLG
ncbi:MAG: 4-hydroxythreonine-4-phosphate dehydrogenase PdxA [Planctomycetes bacterium]|nr:4-hydroxythreonine-4-phosphate dehydrogenase PdxA [Planctomycetota bacterium]NBY02542.1 4-hydroxythreonine-4-phosphate dehydrogenase PdxA [Planctomycetota bacterium]